MNRTSVAPGVYKGNDGTYWARPEINHRRTWRKLKAKATKAAVKEAAETEWTTPVSRFAEVARQYQESGCPNPRLEQRRPEQQASERPILKMLVDFFGRRECSEIRLRDLPAYKAWRVARLLRKCAGTRQVDLELNTLSNVLNYAASMGIIDHNPIKHGRPRFHSDSSVRHCREVAPVDGDELNLLASNLFALPRSEALGWQLLLEAMTGCRTNEILALRMDALGPETAGWVQHNWLCLKRSKRGVNPYALIHPDLREVLDAHRQWHADRYPLSRWYIPGRDGVSPMDPTSLTHAMRRVCKLLKRPLRTSHGLRSFYVTKRRSDGISDPQIAGEIGDKTVELIHRTYGDRPANWLGGEQVSWRPSDPNVAPAWHRWLQPVLPESKVAGGQE